METLTKIVGFCADMVATLIWLVILTGSMVMIVKWIGRRRDDHR